MTVRREARAACLAIGLLGAGLDPSGSPAAEPTDASASERLESRQGRETDAASVTLIAAVRSVRRTEALQLTVGWQAKRPLTIANSGCAPHLEKPFRIAIFDAEKKYLGDAGSASGSFRRVLPSDVVVVPAGERIESRISIVPDAVLFLVTRRQPAGKYYVQLICDRDLTRTFPGLRADRPLLSDREIEALSRPDAPGSLRSNVIEIEIRD